MLVHKKNAATVAMIAIVTIVLTLIGGWVLLQGVSYAAERLDESFEVNQCKIFNGIRFGFEEKSGIATPNTCFTIDKTLDKDKTVPSKRYPGTEQGAAIEMKDMIHNCWNMWWGHDVNDAFSEIPGTQGCFTCYVYRFNKNADDITVESLKNSLQEPFTARDTSNKCSNAGGFCRSQCEEGERGKLKKVCEEKDIGTPLCCTKTIVSECHNKGGTCSKTGSTGEFTQLYNKWRCPGSELCYIKEEQDGKKVGFSSIEYLREFKPKGGDIIFSDGLKFNNEDQIYAISFLSPNGKYCFEDGTVCYLRILGASGATLFVVGSVIAGAFYAGPAVLLSAAGSSLGFALTSPFLALGTITFGQDIFRNVLNFFAEESGIIKETPNLIMVSTQTQAEQLGCEVNPRA